MSDAEFYTLAPNRPCDVAAYAFDASPGGWYHGISLMRDYRIFQSHVSDLIETDFPEQIIVMLHNGQRVNIRKRDSRQDWGLYEEPLT